jgi:molybdopterin-guanine dinucleotide biosynthesis protein A
MNFTCDAPFNNNRFVQRLAISQTGHQKTFTAAFSDNLCNRPTINATTQQISPKIINLILFPFLFC